MVSAEQLQKLMRHRSYSTTQRNINMAGKLNDAVQGLHVPDVLRKANCVFIECYGSRTALTPG